MGNLLQMGYPASMNTNACLGFSVTAYQSWGVARDHCDTYQSTLVRIEGRLFKGHDGKADGLRQKAKVGYCPCCTQATRVELPPVKREGQIAFLLFLET